MLVELYLDARIFKTIKPHHLGTANCCPSLSTWAAQNHQKHSSLQVYYSLLRFDTYLSFHHG